MSTPGKIRAGNSPAAHRLASFLAILSACLWLNSCVLALGGQNHVSGAELPARLEPLEVGSTEEQLIAIYGPPSVRQERSATSVDLQWTEVIRPRACRTYVLGFIPIGGEPRRTRRVDARFVDGRLVLASVSYPDRHGTVSSTDSLLRMDSHE